MEWKKFTTGLQKKEGINLDEYLANRLIDEGSSIFFDKDFTIPWNQLFSHEWMNFTPSSLYDDGDYVRARAGETPYYDYLHDLVKYVDENVKDNNYEEFFKDTLLFGGDGHDPKKLEAFKQTPLYKEYAPSIFERKAGDEHYGNPYKYHKLLHSLVTRQFDKSWPIAVALINEDMPDRLDHQDMEKLKKSEFLVYDGRHRINVMKFLNDLREKGESGANLSSFEHFLYNKLKETYSSSSDGFPNKAPVLLVNNFNTETRSIPEWRKEVEKAESHFLPNSLEGRTLAQTPSSSIGNIHQVMSGRGDTERELGPHPTIGNLLTYRPTPTPTMKQEL